MADWTSIPNVAVAVGGIPSGTTVTALRDNPVSITEGAPGAPRNVPRSLTSEFVLGGGAGSGSDASGISGLDTNAIVRIDYFAGAVGSAVTRVVQLRVSDDNGSSWSGWANISANGRGHAGCVYLNTLNGNWRAQGLVVREQTVEGNPNEAAEGVRETGSFSRTPVNAFQLRMSASGEYSYHAQYVSRGNE